MTNSALPARQRKSVTRLQSLSKFVSDDAYIETIDGEDFLVEPEPRCRVCMAHTRGEKQDDGSLSGEHVQELITDMLMFGSTYKDIDRMVQPLVRDWPKEERPTINSIREHTLRHFSPFQRYARQACERWAKKQNKRILDGEAALISSEAIFETVMAAGMEQIASKKMTPNVKETLVAAKLLKELEQDVEGDQGSTVAAWAELNAIITAIRDTLTADQMDAFSQRLALARGTQPAEVIEDAEIVEDDDDEDPVARVEQEMGSESVD